MHCNNDQHLPILDILVQIARPRRNLMELTRHCLRRRRKVQWWAVAGMLLACFSLLFSLSVLSFWSCESTPSFAGAVLGLWNFTALNLTRTNAALLYRLGFFEQSSFSCRKMQEEAQDLHVSGSDGVLLWPSSP